MLCLHTLQICGSLSDITNAVPCRVHPSHGFTRRTGLFLTFLLLPILLRVLSAGGLNKCLANCASKGNERCCKLAHGLTYAFSSCLAPSSLQPVHQVHSVRRLWP